MDLEQARQEARNVVLQKLVKKFPDADKSGLDDLAESIAEATVAAIDHVLKNAKTAVGGESII